MSDRAAPLVVAWGELLWDLFPDGPRLGGAAANAAVHARALGAEAALVSRVGDDDLGRRGVSALAERGVDTRHVQVDAQAPTGTVRVELEAGEPHFTLATSAAWDRIEATAEVRALLGRADALVYGTLAQRTPLGRGALGALLAETPASVLRVCDLNVRPPHTTPEAIDACLTGVTAVKLNQAEAAYLETLFGTPSAVEFLLRERGVALVALTRGAGGASLRSVDERHDHPGFVIDSRQGDRVGAGDAFSAVLAVELSRRTPLPAILERANRYAAWVASQSGATPPPPPWLVASTPSTLAT